ncbi:MAG: extracellular solute-binding protein [Eubacterium sp.]|nr:extracellular solute-binding protein [Eubacterium sp.]
MKRRKIYFIILMMLLLSIGGCSKETSDSSDTMSEAEYEQKLQEAETTPYGKYPETIYYSLGKVTRENNSNLPDGDTYENNEYTRYLLDKINVQNEDAFEGEESSEYDKLADMAIKTKNIPDIMVVSDYDTLKEVVENDLVEDLTEEYEKCATPTIKSIYESYGDEVLDTATFDGKLMAIPETSIASGPSLIWLRKDWMDSLGLKEPQTIDDVIEIVRAFVEKDPGGNGAGNTVGLVCGDELTGDAGYGYEYQLDMLFASCGAYPKQWIEREGEIVYGSVQPEAREALVKIHGLYEEGIIDNHFLFRTNNNIVDLVESGQCGSFFGPWWAPNNPLMEVVSKNEDADWQPYLVSTDGKAGGKISYTSQKTTGKYVVVRKGYNHPEIVVKIISVLFDYARYAANDAEGIKRYFELNVDPTARPLAINVDYKDALSRCYRDISAVMKGEKEESELPILEDSYYRVCKDYEKKEKHTPEEWAAYTSRITALKIISDAENEGRLDMVDSLYFGETATMKTDWWKLRDDEKEVYLQIVTGDKNISSFDVFITRWKNNGGKKITEEVREELE